MLDLEVGRCGPGEGEGVGRLKADLMEDKRLERDGRFLRGWWSSCHDPGIVVFFSPFAGVVCDPTEGSMFSTEPSVPRSRFSESSLFSSFVCRTFSSSACLRFS